MHRPVRRDRLLDDLGVQRRERAQVDDLDRRAVLELRRLRGGERHLDRRAVGEDGDVGALRAHDGLVQAVRRVRKVGRGAGGAQVEHTALVVAPLGLVEDDGVVAGDRLLHHPVGVLGGGAGHDPQPGGVGEVGLVGLAVVLDRADPAAVGDADDHRQPELAEGAVVHLGDLADDLVEGRVDEAVELDLDDGPVAAQGQADGAAHDPGLGQRGVDDAVLAEVLLQALGDAEDTAELADVLAHEQDLGVALHGGAHAGVEGLGDRGPLGGGAGRRTHQVCGVLPQSSKPAW